MSRQLVPEFKLRGRLIALGIMLIPVLLAWKVGIGYQLLACFVPVVLTGTYRESSLDGDWFHTRFHLGFIPFGKDRCKLPAVVTIFTKYGVNETGYGTFFLLGPVMIVFIWIFDYLMPALGGSYEIWLETAKGREILAWCGNNEAHYKANLELLRSRTSADVRTR